MVFYCAIVIFPTGSVRLESSKGELDSCTRGSPGSAIASGSPFTAVGYNVKILILKN